MMETEREKSLVEIRVRRKLLSPSLLRQCKKGRVLAVVGMIVVWQILANLWGLRQKVLEGEILKLLLRLKNIRDQGKKRGTLGTTRFDREVKKLECSINYDGVSKKNGTDKRGGDRALCFK